MRGPLECDEILNISKMDADSWSLFEVMRWRRSVRSREGMQARCRGGAIRVVRGLHIHNAAFIFSGARKAGRGYLWHRTMNELPSGR